MTRNTVSPLQEYMTMKNWTKMQYSLTERAANDLQTGRTIHEEKNNKYQFQRLQNERSFYAFYQDGWC